MFDKNYVYAFIPTIIIFRVVMAPLPNAEPIMLFTIVAGLVNGHRCGFVTGVTSLSVSDVLIGMAGPWTFYTSLTFGLVGLMCGLLGKTKIKWNRKNLVLLAAIMTIFYDLVTMTIFAIQFMTPFPVALMGQIPFTIMHLSNCVLVFLIAPFLIKQFRQIKTHNITTPLKT